MRLLDSAQDIRSTRLIKCCQGVAASGLIDKKEATLLLAHARAVRLFLESCDRALAQEASDRILEVLAESENDLVTLEVTKHVEHLNKIL